MRIVVLCVNSFYVLSTISVYKENSENTRWTPWGWGNPKAVTYGWCGGQIVTGAADRIPDLKRQVAHQVDSFLHGSHFK